MIEAKEAAWKQLIKDNKEFMETVDAKESSKDKGDA
jgi:hypothetical protein